MNNLAANSLAANPGAEAAAPFIPTSLVILIAIILISGLIGGFAQYLNQEPPPKPSGDKQGDEPAPAPVPAPPRSLPLMLLLGVIAAACVPLFLSLVKSKLVEDILGSGATRLESLLVFTGLCLVAAFSARRFIDAVSASVLRRLEQVEDKAGEADEKADQAKRTAKDVAREIDSEAADDPTEPPPAEARQGPDLTDAEASQSPITPEERRILQAMTTRTYRTRTGIAEDSGIAKSRISELLEGLEARKLALPTRSPSTGGQRWIITRRGNEALKRA